MRPLEGDAVAALQRRFVAGLDARLDRLGEMSEAQRDALRGLLLAGARRGSPVGEAQLQQALQRTPAEIAAEAAGLPHALPAAARQRMIAAAEVRRSDERWHAVFAEGERVYFPLQAGAASSTERQVGEALAAQGYSIVDYAGGHATDARGKQRFRIGKLLQRLDAGLYERFQHDPRRTRDRLLVCLSRDALDIGRMSTAQAWHSCMSLGDSQFPRIPAEIKAGSLIAYLISESDAGLAQPLGRILLKPFTGPGGAELLLPAKPYGLANSDFAATVSALARQLSGPVPEGRYTLRPGIYGDDLPEALLHVDGPLTTEKLLDVSGCRWSRGADGEIVVDGDLDLRNLGLQYFPDMRQVTVTGDFLASDNLLNGAMGMPQRIGGSISLAGNRIPALRGVPAEVAGDFDVSRNSLITLWHAPQRVGGSVDLSRNSLTSLDRAPGQVGGDFSCGWNALRSLRGAPDRVPGNFDCSRNKLATLDGGPSDVGGVYDCRENDLASLVGIAARIGDDLICSDNSLTDLTGLPDGLTGGIESDMGTFARRSAAPRRMYLKPSR